MSAPETKPAPFSFSGQVESGKIYTHALPEGLYFHLYPNPDGSGWEISVNNVEDKYMEGIENYARITRPLHGPNAIFISFDHFALDKIRDLAFDPNKRGFEFALSYGDTQRIFDAYECSGNLPLDVREGKKCKLGPLPVRRGFGTLLIKEIILPQDAHAVGGVKIYTGGQIKFDVTGQYMLMGYNE
jgi:hypothetical protein